LRIDYDYARRSKALAGDDEDEEPKNDDTAGLLIPAGRAVFGAVVMTQESSKPLRMLVNREGFVPDGALDALSEVIKKGINLYVRERAAITRHVRDENRDARAQRRETLVAAPATFTFDRAQRALDENLVAAREEASRAAKFIRAGEVDEAEAAVRRATLSLVSASQVVSQVLPEQSLVRILASVGMQLGAFVHEVRGVHAMAASIRLDIERHTAEHEAELPAATRRFLRSIYRRISDLTQSLERHASYLVDTLSADSRRRRSPQSLRLSIDQSLRLVETQLQRRKIKLVLDVDPEVKTPPIFAPELTLILTNLLTNAIKAAGTNGRIKVQSLDDGNTLRMRIENSGEAVDLASSEQWFRPFESSTSDPDPVLGRGMGMGLPITRNMIESYGGEIHFVKPGSQYKTAILFTFPRKK
jgi:signal transduction histidine kinase